MSDPSFGVFVNSIFSAACTSLAMTYVNTGEIVWTTWSINWFIVWCVVSLYMFFVAPRINRLFPSKF